MQLEPGVVKVLRVGIKGGRGGGGGKPLRVLEPHGGLWEVDTGPDGLTRALVGQEAEAVDRVESQESQPEVKGDTGQCCKPMKYNILLI